jgi:hypothetical protein
MKELIEEMRVSGVTIDAWKGSVTDASIIDSIKEQAKAFPIRGVVQGAMVLQVSYTHSLKKGPDSDRHRTVAWKI